MTRNLKTIILLFLVAGIEMIYASDPKYNLRITKKTGTSDFELSTIQELKFLNGNMVVNEIGDITNTFTISDISNISFVNSMVSGIQNNKSEEKLNHALKDNLLTLRFTDDIKSPYIVILYSSSGVVLSTQKWAEGQSVSIPVGSFPSGVYICTLKSEDNIYNFQFIKK